MTSRNKSQRGVGCSCGADAIPGSIHAPNCDSNDEDWEFEEQDWECTHCGGEGFCWDGSDPLGDCPDEIHNCHACRGSGKRKDQVIF